ncbi:TRADD-N-associated membrane domain-containing protein [Phaeacidiphilus oryzae]|uniref:TRADD-N-associated membrane domain-containing protein n=1 Tax=Phaeacidiphilus oryzae TaxID=348818 RepID=UPI00126A6E2B|nr:hypothetical protein [Phaeacidiphilus oryzae]
MAANGERKVRGQITSRSKNLAQIDGKLEELRSRLIIDNRTGHLSAEARSALIRELSRTSKRREILLKQLEVRSPPIIVTGGSNVINTGQTIRGPQTNSPSSASAIKIQGQSSAVHRKSSDRRVEFVYGSLQDERTEAKVAFWLSLTVASLAAIIALSAAGIALFHDGDQSTKWVTSFVSAVVAIAGGVWHKQARQARDKVSAHVERVEKQVEADERYEKTKAWIDRVRDPAMRDRLNAGAIIAELGYQADPNILTDRLLGRLVGEPEALPGDKDTGGTRNPDART